VTLRKLLREEFEEPGAYHVTMGIGNVQDFVVSLGSESLFATDRSMGSTVKIIAGAIFAIAAVLIYIYVIDDAPPASDPAVTAPTPSD